MPICNVNFYSISLDKQEQMNVIVPPGNGPFGVLYLLHGLSGDHTTWLVRSRIEQYIESKRLIAVMPNVGRSFYVNDPRPGGQKYEDHVIRDVIGTIDRLFPTIRTRSARAVAGMSMGGYAAMMLAMRHPEKFSVAVAHSAAFGFGRDIQTEHTDVNVLSSVVAQSKYDVFALARKLSNSGRKLALRIDCGVDDCFIEHSRKFHAHLSKLAIAHEYAEHPGEHNWDYWEAHIKDTLRFALKHLKKK